MNLKRILKNRGVTSGFKLKPNIKEGGVDFTVFQSVSTCRSKTELLFLGYELYKNKIFIRGQWFDFRDDVCQAPGLKDDVVTPNLKICNNCIFHLRVVTFIGKSKVIISISHLKLYLKSLIDDGVIIHETAKLLIQKAATDTKIFENPKIIGSDLVLYEQKTFLERACSRFKRLKDSSIY